MRGRDPLRSKLPQAGVRRTVALVKMEGSRRGVAQGGVQGYVARNKVLFTKSLLFQEFTFQVFMSA